MIVETTVTRRRFLEVGGIAGLLALAACGGSGASDATAASGEGAAATDAAATSGSTLVLGIADEPTGFDVQQIDWENAAHQLIYEPLITYSPDMSTITPAFAESFEASEDGLTFTFKLPADAKFCNGDACDAAAVKASFERYVKTSPYATDYEDVESFEAVDATTFVMHFKQPAPYAFAPLVSSYAGIVNAAVADTMSADDFTRAPITNGAYYVENWEQGNQVTFKRNEHFKTNNPALTNSGVAPFETIVMRFVPDEFTRVSEVEDGGIDLVFNVPAASVADLEANDGITLFKYMQPGSNFLLFNTEAPEIADVAIRQAITYAINRDEIAQALDGVVTPMYGYLSPAMSCYDEAEETKLKGVMAFDLDKAKKTLADAGYADSDGDGIVEKDGKPVSFELFVSSDRPAAKAAAPVLQTQLAAAGIDAQIREYEAAYIKSMMRDDKYVIGWRNFDWVDPDLLYNGIFTPVSGYSWDDPEITAILERARTLIDTTERAAAYAEFQDLMATKFKAVPLFFDNYAYAGKVRLSGVVVTNDGRIWFNDASLA